VFIITFYSFKGGVGRTFALVNVGAELARRGRRVLLVDFDLEAPGLETFERLRPPPDHPGLVEYIAEYLRTKQIPDVRPFVYSAGTVGKKDGQLWVMPAGRRDVKYQASLVNIDWKRLYRDLKGFELFEDTKKQWEEAFKPDYVLIDSRTGHTDVEGICTRQLPDAVVVLFFPNEQNLVGLRDVCRRIHAERERGLEKNIRLHFVMSNVPDLDDEDKVLRRRLQAFHKELGIDRMAAVIHRYESVMLFNQAIFVLDRPRSRLAREYRRLARTLLTENPADREGALRFLHQYVQDYLPKVAQDIRVEMNRKLGVVQEKPGVSMEDPDLASLVNAFFPFSRDFHVTSREELDKLDRIIGNFPNDGELLQRIAECRMLGNDFEKALDVLNRALIVQPYLPQALLDRAACHKNLRNIADATADLLNYCRLGGLESRAVVSALRQLSVLAPEKVPEALDLPAVRALPRGGMLAVAEILAERDEGLPRAVQIVREYGGGSDAGRILLFQYLIRLHLWREGIEVLGEPPMPLFHLAMALWGETGALREDLCRQAVQREKEEYGKYYDPDSVPMCLMLWQAGQIAEAIQTLDRIVERSKENPLQMFSYWTFRRVSPYQYLADCQQFRRMIQGEPIRPAFLGDPADVGEAE